MTTIEKIEKIVLPSLRKGLEMEGRATSGPWHWVYGDTDKPCDYALPERGATKDAEMEVFFNPRLETVWEEGEGWRRLPKFIAPVDSEVRRSDAAFIARARNEWRRQTEALILAIEGYLHGTGSFWPKEVRDYCQSNLQAIANLWPDEE